MGTLESGLICVLSQDALLTFSSSIPSTRQSSEFCCHVFDRLEHHIVFMSDFKLKYSYAVFKLTKNILFFFSHRFLDFQKQVNWFSGKLRSLKRVTKSVRKDKRICPFNVSHMHIINCIFKGASSLAIKCAATWDLAVYRSHLDFPRQDYLPYFHDIRHAPEVLAVAHMSSSISCCKNLA